MNFRKFERKRKPYYTIFRYWWKFWQIDVLEFTLPTCYEEAYEEVERKTLTGKEYSMELYDWVKDDIRDQLIVLVLECPKLVSKAKKLHVKFRTTGHGNQYIDGMDFYLRGDIYFDSDEAIKREKILNKLGI